VELWKGVHLVGSGRGGFDLTDPLDCHVYLLDAGDSWILVDAGAGLNVELLVEQITSVAPPDRVRTLILTHKHADHAGGAALLRQHFDLTIIASEHTAETISLPDEERLGLIDARSAGVYPLDYTFSPTRVDRTVGEGDHIRVGKISLRAIATPGHCEGHLSFIGEVNGRRTLFTGDALFHGGKVVWQTTYDCSVQEHVRSIRRLEAESFDAFLPGHLSFSLARGKRHVEAALSYIKEMNVPPHLM